MSSLVTRAAPKARVQATSTPSPHPSAGRRRKKTRQPMSRASRIQQRYGYLFVAIPMLLFFVFALLPVLMALVMGFTNYSVIGSFNWVGWSNFSELFQDPLFWTSLKNTAIYTVLYVPMGLIAALGTAMLINRKAKVAKLFRTFFYIPVVCSSVASATIWFWLLNPDNGLFNIILGWFGIDGPAWLQSSKWAMFSIVMMSVWSTFGTNMMIYLAGLQNVSPDLIEAAKLDGANSVQRFWHVVLPQLRRTTFLVSTLLIVGAFQVFDQAFVLTDGGPGNSTLTLVYYIYNEGFGSLKMGYASAMSFVLFAIILVFSLLNARVTNRTED